MQLDPTADRSPLSHREATAHLADRVGAVASFLCALHCAALPFVLVLLPAVSLGFLADHGFEKGFILCASVFALVTLIHGYRRHHTRRALAFLAPGLALLWVGGFALDSGSSIGWHALLVALGGSCVALAHLTNMSLVHGLKQNTCCGSPTA
jgi:MerC mercury resistance protein